MKERKEGRRKEESEEGKKVGKQRDTEVRYFTSELSENNGLQVCLFHCY